MTQPNLNAAIDQTTSAADQISKAAGLSPVEVLVYAAVAALMPHMTAAEAHEQFAKARVNLEKAGLQGKK